MYCISSRNGRLAEYDTRPLFRAGGGRRASLSTCRERGSRWWDHRSCTTPATAHIMSLSHVLPQRPSNTLGNYLMMLVVTVILDAKTISVMTAVLYVVLVLLSHFCSYTLKLFSPLQAYYNSDNDARQWAAAPPAVVSGGVPSPRTILYSLADWMKSTSVHTIFLHMSI